MRSHFEILKVRRRVLEVTFARIAKKKKRDEVSLVETLLELNVVKYIGAAAKINFGVCFSELLLELPSTPYFLGSVNCPPSRKLSL